jgi:hypothetical protein
MPIDLRRVVKNRHQDRYRLSVAARGDDHVGHLFDEALAWQETNKKLLRERDSCKSQLTDKSRLKELEDQLTAAQLSLQTALWKLPNWFDSDADHSHAYGGSTPSPDTAPTQKAEDDKESELVPPLDPLFCARCYEELGCSTALVGPGSQLATALNRFVVDSMQTSLNELSQDINLWNLPSSLESISTSQCHDIWGCSGPSCRFCLANGTTKQLPAPSWATLLRNQYGTYWDRQLPKISLLSCTSVHTTECPLDERDGARLDTGGRHKKKQQPWHQRLAVQEQIQIMAVTGPSLEADSRPLQRRIIERLRDLFQQLIGDDVAPIVRIRAIPAAELLPMESSRLVVEGFLSLRPVCLAYISNLQDYCTSSSAMRHGTTKEGLHVLQGTICSVAPTMDWIARNRSEQSSFTLPRVLVHFSLSDRLLYTRKIVVNKNGKRFVEDIVVAVDDDKSKPEQQHGVPCEIAKPTSHRIRAEALSSPFGFLPFHYR